MKITSYTILVLMFTTPLLLSGCASREASGDSIPVDNNRANKTLAVVEKENSPSVSEERIIDGGYSESSTDSENVEESFDFLKKKLAISSPEIFLVKVQKAETQVVAGWKTRLVCEYTIGENKEIHVLKSVIYKDPAKNLTLDNLEFDINK